MEERSDMNKMDDQDVMLPGFRFHPTDEELVGFYLKRKIQQRDLPIELIKQVDIYKFDPWDLPKLASSGEKEWYFYCPRDRKYRNSARPNRVTVAGFWKATGTDRPIYSSNGTECIGLKKSLVFYRGRAAKGLKTDWMMHEFRLPSSATSAPSSKGASDKTLPLNDSWAICRIFKKTNSMAQRALSRSWLSQTHDTSSPDYIHNQIAHYNIFSPDHGSCTTETDSPRHLPNNNRVQYHGNSTFSPPEYKPITNQTFVKSHLFPFSTEFIPPIANILTGDIDFQGQKEAVDGVIDPLVSKNLDIDCANNEWGIYTNALDMWKGDSIWDSLLCPSDISATFSTN